jgi:FkbM family methyltransferase
MLRFSDEERSQLTNIIQCNGKDGFENIIEEASKYLIVANSVVIDGGANIGRHSAHFLETLERIGGGGGAVYGVEAIPALSHILEKKFKSTNVYSSINAALYNVSGHILDFYYVINCSGRSSIAKPNVPSNLKPAIKKIAVQSITIDEILKNEDSRKCSFIKLDLEGAEYFAILGAKQTLQEDRPIICFEDTRTLHSLWNKEHDLHYFFDFMKDNKYKLISLYGEQLNEYAVWIQSSHPWYTWAIPEEKIAVEIIILKCFLSILVSSLPKDDFEFIKRSAFFDEKYYLSKNQDVKDSNMDPALHYLYYGWKEGRDPSCKFSTNTFIQSNPDVLKFDINPIVYLEKYQKMNPK